MPKPVIIEEYDPEWPRTFAELAGVIGAAVGDLALAIEHVGSTSVPGLAAKPIIDLDVVVASEADIPEVTRRLAGLGYVAQGDKGVPGREAFGRPAADVPYDGTDRLWPEHHLYVCPQGSPALARHLALRDALRASPADAAAYADLKFRLAGQFRHDREAYCDAKTEFVEAVLQRWSGEVPECRSSGVPE